MTQKHNMGIDLMSKWFNLLLLSVLCNDKKFWLFLLNLLSLIVLGQLLGSYTGEETSTEFVSLLCNIAFQVL